MVDGIEGWVCWICKGPKELNQFFVVFPYIFESSDIVNVCAISVINEDDGDSDDSEERVDDC